MGQRSDEIKRQIDEKRSELSENLEKLEERVKSTTDWRAQFDKRPMVMLGIAFGGGILASTLVPRASRRPRSSSYTGYRPSEGSTTQGYTGSSESTGEGYGLMTSATKTKRNTSTSRELHKAWDTIDNIRASLVAFGSHKLREYLGSVIPGFDEIYRRTENEHKGYQTARTGMGPTDYSPASTTPQI